MQHFCVLYRSGSKYEGNLKGPKLKYKGNLHIQPFGTAVIVILTIVF